MKNIPLKYKIIGGSVLAIILLIALKPNVLKNVYKKLISEYEEVDKNLLEQIEKLENQKEKDSIYYSEQLLRIESEYQEELIKANEKYYWLNHKYKQNAKELDTYRSADFNGKFELFSNTVIGQDTVSR